jgi:hypothetical protein
MHLLPDKSYGEHLGNSESGTGDGEPGYLADRKQMIRFLDEISSVIESSNRTLETLEGVYKGNERMSKEERERFERDVYELVKGEENAKRALTDFTAGLKELHDDELQKRAEETVDKYAAAHQRTAEFARTAGIPLVGWEEMLYR